METSKQSLPPYYILVSHSSADDAVPGAPSSNFSHPVIQYQYRDDSTIPLLPQHPDEHVLVLDYDPSPRFSTVKNISGKVVVTNLKVDEAPGAAVADGKNNHMFVIETTSDDQYVAKCSLTTKSPESMILAECSEFLCNDKISPKYLGTI